MEKESYKHFWGAKKVVARNQQFLLATAPNIPWVQLHGGYKGKVIPPSKGHGSNDKKEKETNIGYYETTQGKSVLNYLCLSLNVPLLVLAVRKSKKKAIKFPPSSQEECLSEKVDLGDEAPEVSKVWRRAQG